MIYIKRIRSNFSELSSCQLLRYGIMLEMVGLKY